MYRHVTEKYRKEPGAGKEETLPFSDETLIKLNPQTNEIIKTFEPQVYLINL